MLTQGTSQALDLILRRFVRPGETVLVDDPGYYNLFGSLRSPAHASSACRAIPTAP